jgi:hypothetical protein
MVRADWPLLLPACATSSTKCSVTRNRAASVDQYADRYFKVARPEGLEPPTLCFEGRCSIQLSYRRVEANQKNWSRGGDLNP